MKRMLLAATAFTAMAWSSAFATELKVYHWFEYMPQELVDKFSAETGIKVTIDTYDSNEAMLASLKAGKLGQYDVAGAGDYMVKIMADQGPARQLQAGGPRQLRQHRGRVLDVPFDPAASTRSPISGARPHSRSTATSSRATSTRSASSSIRRRN